MKKEFIEAVLAALVSDNQTRAIDDWRGTRLSWTKC